MRHRLFCSVVIVVTALATYRVEPTMAANPVLIQIGSLTGTRGTNVTIPITISATTGTVVGVQVDVVFETSRLQIGTLPGACSLGSGLLATHTLEVSSPTSPPPGTGYQRVRLFIYPQSGTTSLIGNGQAASCTFLVKSTAPLGASKLRAQLNEASDSAGIKVFSKGVDGTLTVQ